VESLHRRSIADLDAVPQRIIHLCQVNSDPVLLGEPWWHSIGHHDETEKE